MDTLESVLKRLESERKIVAYAINGSQVEINVDGLRHIHTGIGSVEGILKELRLWPEEFTPIPTKEKFPVDRVETEDLDAADLEARLMEIEKHDEDLANEPEPPAPVVAKPKGRSHKGKPA